MTDPVSIFALRNKRFLDSVCRGTQEQLTFGGSKATVRVDDNTIQLNRPGFPIEILFELNNAILYQYTRFDRDLFFPTVGPIHTEQSRRATYGQSQAMIALMLTTLLCEDKPVTTLTNAQYARMMNKP